MRVAILVAVTLIVQRALGWPGGPTQAGLLVLPMVWIVGPALIHHTRQHLVQLAILLGLAWDLMLEPIVGPGGIAWSATALVVGGLAGIVADRSPKAWFAFGAAGTLALTVARRVVLLPFGMTEPWRLTDLALSLVLTGAWCGLVGWIRALDLGSRWVAYRARKLR